MAEFEINCPHCGEELTVQKEWVGKEGKCPSCKKTFTISLKHRKFPRPGKKSSGNCNMSEDDDSEDDGSGWSEWIYPILVVLFFSMLFIFVECHAKKAPQARETSHESIMNDEEIARRKKQEHEYKKALKRIENISGGFESTD